MLAAPIASEVVARRRSAREVASEALSRLEATVPLNLVSDMLAERALARADVIDRAIAAGLKVGPLAGVPFAAKNLFDVAGMATRAGSKINRDAPAAAQDAEAIRRLEAAGAVLIATTNMDEYAYGFTSENAHDGDARNPRDPLRTPGGSSGGSAGLVAGGLAPLAIGSDTNGSIRVPAALSGCFGLKPTFGRLSRRGAFPFVASLDHVGPFARSVADLAVAYDAMQGPDAADPVCAAKSVSPVSELLDAGVGQLRIAMAGGYFGAPLDEDVREAVERAGQMLGSVEEVRFPEPERARAAGFVITASEGGALHRQRLATRPFDIGPLVRDRLFAGALVPSQWYIAAQRFRRWFTNALGELFERHDVIVLPTVPCVAPLIGDEEVTIAGETIPARLALGLFVQPLTISGFPIAVAPTLTRGGLPTGVQLLAAPGREDHALMAARQLERAGFCDGLFDD